MSRAEEDSKSQVMGIMSWLSDVYGPRLTWSPNADHARDWTMRNVFFTTVDGAAVKTADVEKVALPKVAKAVVP